MVKHFLNDVSQNNASFGLCFLTQKGYSFQHFLIRRGPGPSAKIHVVIRGFVKNLFYLLTHLLTHTEVSNALLVLDARVFCNFTLARFFLPWSGLGVTFVEFLSTRLEIPLSVVVSSDLKVVEAVTEGCYHQPEQQIHTCGCLGRT